MGPIQEDLAQVRFSPQQFKTLVRALKGAIDAWETSFGEIVTTVPDMDLSDLANSLKTMKETAEKGAP